MTLHLQKLCVGAESMEDLASWQEGEGRRISRKRGYDTPSHRTRMQPKRVAELLDGGSLYWVIKGLMRARQRLIDLRQVTDKAGVTYCDLVLDPELVALVPRPCRAFQGWRYLKPEDAPRDLSGFGENAHAFEHFPPKLQAELAELGLL